MGKRKGSAATTRGRGRVDTQTPLPDPASPTGTMAPPSVAAINTAAKTYQNVKLERCSLTEQETKDRETLLTQMEKAGLEYYQVPGTDLEVVVTTGSKECKVRTRKAAAAN